MPMRDRLGAGWKACAVVLGAVLLGVTGAGVLRRPGLLALAGLMLVVVVALVRFLPFSGVAVADEVRLARPVPADVPRRPRARAWPWLVGGALAAVVVPAVLVLVLLGSGAAVSVLLGTVPLLMQLGVLRRQESLVADWEAQHHVQVLVPVGLRNPARRGCYVRPLSGAGAGETPAGSEPAR